MTTKVTLWGVFICQSASNYANQIHPKDDWQLINHGYTAKDLASIIKDNELTELLHYSGLATDLHNKKTTIIVNSKTDNLTGR